MTTSLRILGDVYKMWRSPTQAELPLDTAFMELKGAAAELGNDVMLSSEGRALVSVPLPVGTQTVDIPVNNMVLPDTIMARPIGSTDDSGWKEVPTVRFKDFARAMGEGRDVATVFGTPPKVKFSMDVTGREFELWYPLAMAVPARIEEEPQLGTVWERLLTVMTAIGVGPEIKIEGKEFQSFYIKNMLKLQGADGESGLYGRLKKQWKKYLERDTGGVSYRSGFHDRSDDIPGIGWPRAT